MFCERGVWEGRRVVRLGSKGTFGYKVESMSGTSWYRLKSRIHPTGTGLSSFEVLLVTRPSQRPDAIGLALEM